eukprot:943610-Pelagomonas_calceolata.AAC.6
MPVVLQQVLGRRLSLIRGLGFRVFIPGVHPLIIDQSCLRGQKGSLCHTKHSTRHDCHVSSLT